MIRKHTLTSSAGVRMPGIIYGTAWKEAETARLVTQAIKAGFRGIDTACQPKHYNEAGVGEGVKACLHKGLRREDLYLQTKFTPVDGQDPDHIPYDPDAAPAEQVRQSVETSLGNLQTTYLDGLVLHSPLKSQAGMRAVWAAMESYVDTGIVRQLGISNCYRLDLLETLHKTARVKPIIVQNRFHAKTGYDCEIREFCRHHGMIYQSFWTLTANPDLLAHRTIKMLALMYAVTPAQILFRYLTQIGVVPLTGTTSAAHMREDLAIFDFTLQETERDDITRMFDLFTP